MSVFCARDIRPIGFTGCSLQPPQKFLKTRLIGICRGTSQIWGLKSATALLHPQIWDTITAIPEDPIGR
jgi:hypothetical protein